MFSFPPPSSHLSPPLPPPSSSPSPSSSSLRFSFIDLTSLPNDENPLPRITPKEIPQMPKFSFELVDPQVPNNSPHSPPSLALPTKSFASSESSRLREFHSSVHQSSFLSSLSESFESLQIAHSQKSLRIAEQKISQWTAEREKNIFNEESQKIFEEIVGEETQKVVTIGRKILPLRDDEILRAKNLIGGKETPPKGCPTESVNLRSLKSLAWLDDVIINEYLKLLEGRQSMRGKIENYFFNSFFYAKLCGPSGFSFDSVKRWTRKVTLWNFRRLFIPIHINGNHWTLGVIDFSTKSMEYFDSLGGRPPTVFVTLKKYLKEEAISKGWGDIQKDGGPFQFNPFEVDEWQTVFRSDIPRQSNGSDCGVFTLKFADFLSEDLPLEFSAKHMEYFRLRMALELVAMRVQ